MRRFWKVRPGLRGSGATGTRAAPLEMTVLLAFLLALGLPRADTNVTGTGRQGALQCHSCEEFYTLSCAKATECEPGSVFCVTVVVRMLVRFFYVSRQCTEYCPVVKPMDVLPYQSYVLLKPTPFLYASCCRTPLCNTDSPTINETEWQYYREAAGARRGGARLALLLTLAALPLGLGAP